MAQKTKRFTINAFQIDLHYLKGNGHAIDAVKWDVEIALKIFKHVFNLSKAERNHRDKDSWFMFLEHLEDDEHYIFGNFLSAKYGTIGKLVHADQLTERDNPKLIREGETEPTYFIIKKADGLLLLQSNKILKRPIFEEYLENLGEDILHENNFTNLQIRTLVEKDFFESISQLNKVRAIKIEVSRLESVSSENEVVCALRGAGEEIAATHVELTFKAKKQKLGLRNPILLARKYKDKKGINKIVILGNDATGAEKVINLDVLQERYRKGIHVDANNQPMLTSAQDVMREIADKRNLLRV